MCDYSEKCRYNDTLLPGMGLPEKLYIFRYKRFRSWKKLPGGVWNKEKVSTFASENQEIPWDIQWT